MRDGLAQTAMAQDHEWTDHGFQPDGWRLRSRPLTPEEINDDDLTTNVVSGGSGRVDPAGEGNLDAPSSPTPKAQHSEMADAPDDVADDRVAVVDAEAGVSLSRPDNRADFRLPVESTRDSGQPVQAGSPAQCPALTGWREKDGLQLPRRFTAVPHLRVICETVQADLAVSQETCTGWQIQWSTPCTVCGKRFRPVAGFVPLRTVKFFKEKPDNEQFKHVIGGIIRKRFESGSVSGGHSGCAD